MCLAAGAATTLPGPAIAFLDEERARESRRAAAVAEADENIVGRIALEGAGWILAGFVGVGAAAALGEDFGPPLAILGIVMAPPGGVTLGAAILDGRGSYWWSLLAGLVGWLPAIAVIAAADDGDYSAGDQAVAISLALSFPMAGAMFGYEVTNEPDGEDRRDRPDRGGD